MPSRTERWASGCGHFAWYNSSMTRLMEKALQALRSLPEEQQDAVAGFVLSEIEADRQWAQTSLQHADNLRKLADEAAGDLRAGRTSELDPEKL